MWVLLLKVTVGSVTAAFLFVAVVYDFENIFLYRFKSGTSELLFSAAFRFSRLETVEAPAERTRHMSPLAEAHEQRPTNTHRTFSRRQQLDTQRRSSPRYHTTVVNSPVTVNTCNFSRYVQCFCMKSDREAFVIFFFFVCFCSEFLVILLHCVHKNKRQKLKKKHNNYSRFIVVNSVFGADLHRSATRSFCFPSPQCPAMSSLLRLMLLLLSNAFLPKSWIWTGSPN